MSITALTAYLMLDDWSKHETFYVAMLAMLGIAYIRLIVSRLREKPATQS